MNIDICCSICLSSAQICGFYCDWTRAVFLLFCSRGRSRSMQASNEKMQPASVVLQGCRLVHDPRRSINWCQSIETIAGFKRMMCKLVPYDRDNTAADSHTQHHSCIQSIPVPPQHSDKHTEQRNGQPLFRRSASIMPIHLQKR
jgi:hypothetical protein